MSLGEVSINGNGKVSLFLWDGRNIILFKMESEHFHVYKVRVEKLLQLERMKGEKMQNHRDCFCIII